MRAGKFLIAAALVISMASCTENFKTNSAEIDQVALDSLFQENPDSAAGITKQILLKNPLKIDSAWALKRLGTYYMHKGDNEKSIKHYFRALKAYQLQHDTLGQAAIYLNLTNVDDRPAQRQLWHKKSIENYGSIARFDGVAKNWVNMGSSYLDSNNLPKADSLFRLALDLSYKNGYEQTQISSALNLAIVKNKKGEKELARQFLRPTLQHYINRDNKIGIVYGYFNLGQFFTMLQPDSVIFYTRKAIEAADKDYPQIQSLSYQTLRDVSAFQGNYEEALYYHHLHDSIADRQIEINGLNLMDKMQAEYDLAQSQQQARLLAAQVKEKNYLIVFISAGIILFLILLRFIIGAQKKRAVKSRELHEANQQLMEAQNQLHKGKLERLQIEERLARKKLYNQRIELSQLAARIVNHKQLTSSVRRKLKDSARSVTGKNELNEMIRELNQIAKDQKAGRMLMAEAMKVYHHHLQVFSQRHPELTESDLEYLILIDLELNYKEIAVVMGIKDKSVIMRRYTIRKRLGLQEGEDLEVWLRKAWLELYGETKKAG